MLAIKSETGPALVSGAFDVTFGQFEKVAEAAVIFDGPNDADEVYEATRSIATNVVTITVKKMTVSETNTWGAAITTDVALKTFTVIADGL
ncbi:unnamed protein product [marine sediment metagenome]|uniref:Uncharacterized protein n=1 Tax=marine sediment metagenome TaxID=412755 RepID=X1S223_9ZZZZ